MPKRRIAIGLLLAMGIILLLSPVSGYKIETISINPQGDLPSGTDVTLSFSIDSLGACPPCNDLQMSSALDDVIWNYTISRSREDPKTFTITNNTLFINYSEARQISRPITVSLQGHCPSVAEFGNITLIQIYTRNTTHLFSEETPTERTALVVNVTAFTHLFDNVRANMSRFKEHIDEESSRGTNISDAELKYETATRTIDILNCDCGDTSPIHIYNLLHFADDTISEGEQLLREKVTNANETPHGSISDIESLHMPGLVNSAQTQSSLSSDCPIVAVILCGCAIVLGRKRDYNGKR